MDQVNDLLVQVFQQYGLLGLIIAFLVTGPGYTYLRTRSLRAEGEAHAQELVNEFARQERQRSERLEMKLSAAQRKLDTAEEEVAHLRSKLSEAQTQLEMVATLRRQVRQLRKRVSELESQVEAKTAEIEHLRTRLELRTPNRDQAVAKEEQL